MCQNDEVVFILATLNDIYFQVSNRGISGALEIKFVFFVAETVSFVVFYHVFYAWTAFFSASTIWSDSALFTRVVGLLAIKNFDLVYM